MSGYPFQCGLNIDFVVSRKLKIMAVASGVTVTKIVSQVVDYVYNEIDASKLIDAKIKLGVDNL